MKVIGAGTNTRNADGSEPLHSLAVDSQGRLYTMTWGNPGLVTHSTPGSPTYCSAEGQFKWADPWSVHSGYTVLGIDPQDRLWVATTHVQNPKGVNYAKYHATPCVLRVQRKFFDPASPGITQRSAMLLGFTPTLATSLPYAIAYDLQPVPVEFLVGPATRQIREITVDWRVQELRGAVVAKGRFELPLTDREPAQRNFTWTPPRFGWYIVTAEMSYRGQRLGHRQAFRSHTQVSGHGCPCRRGVGRRLGRRGRQMFAGLSNIRLHCGRAKESLDQLEKQIDLASQVRGDVLRAVLRQGRLCPTTSARR